jgi:2',3'-cyclic-nucleotide 2'-phosphodiesterase / 3'-nucleotidase
MLNSKGGRLPDHGTCDVAQTGMGVTVIDNAQRRLKHVISDQAITVALRLLATSDVHAHLLAWDYYADRASDAVGLVRVAGLMAEARLQVANCLYFDNGDLIEGSALGEYQAHIGQMPGQGPHPMVAALNALGCDAAALGNHELSYGMAFLRATLAGARYPVLSANILIPAVQPASQDQPLVLPYVILDRQVADDQGKMHPLRIGVLGLTPPQVLQWERARIDQPLTAQGMVQAARMRVPELRAAGADLVVVLAHTGVGVAEGPENDENLGLRLSAIPGIDALILGHEHRVFPSAHFHGLAGVDLEHGLLGQVPAVMPGPYGTNLGVIDLVLRRDANGWGVAHARAEARPIAARGRTGEALPLVPDDSALACLAAPAHHATRAWMGRQIGHSDLPLHSYFALADHSAMNRLIAAAQLQHLQQVVAGTPYAGLPLLASVAPAKSGGRGGPEHFADVPAGPLQMRHAADLYPFPNAFAAIIITGAGLRDWLERGVSAYAQIVPGGQDQPLMNPDYPGTALEMITGLSYMVDLSAPPHHDARGHVLNPQAHRIHRLTWQGQPVSPTDMFALATNSYRLAMATEVMTPPPHVIMAAGDGCRDLLLGYLAGHDTVPVPAPRAWVFAPMPGTTVTLDAAPAALTHQGDICALRPAALGLTEAGFLRFRLHL